LVPQSCSETAMKQCKGQFRNKDRKVIKHIFRCQQFSIKIISGIQIQTKKKKLYISPA
jgi:hypothetical protein